MISALIVNYRAAALTVQACRSVSASHITEPLEVLVVDNSADPAEAESLRRHLDPACTLIVNPHNQGFGAACNTAYAQAKGEWILLLNPDATLAPDALRHMWTFLRVRACAAAAGPRMYWDPARRYLLPPSVAPSPLRQFWENPPPWLGGARTHWWWSLLQRNQAQHYWRTQRPLRQYAVSGGHVLLRRKFLERVGGLFDPRFFLYYEDTDLFVRLDRANFEVWLVPQATGVHGFNACAREQQAWKWQQMAQAHRQFMAKHYAGHRLSRGRQRFERASGKADLPRIRDLGKLSAPPRFPVPERLRRGWLLELSLSPWFVPSIARYGDGPEAGYPPESAELLPHTVQYARLGPSNGFYVAPEIWRWEYAG